MKTQNFIVGTILLSTILGGSGCVTRIANLTPQQIPANPSDIYTFSFAANFTKSKTVRESAVAAIVVNGKRFEMHRSDIGATIFEVDYKMPPNTTEVRYYYILKYDYYVDQRKRTRELFSDIYPAQLVNRYVIQLESDRAPVGAQVAVVGRGFSQYDVLLMGAREVPTEYISPNSLSFYVPSLPSGRSYPVALRTGQGDIPVGTFRIDSATLSILPKQLSLAPGESIMMLITVDFEAPPGGLYIDATTDVPASIIMPRVIIEEGARSVDVPVEGGEEGSGTLFVDVPGFNIIEVPVTVF